MDRGKENLMRLVVKPLYEKHRTFRHIGPAMRFAEAARFRQGQALGPVVVWQQRSDGEYRIIGGFGGLVRKPGLYGWSWSNGG